MATPRHPEPKPPPRPPAPEHHEPPKSAPAPPPPEHHEPPKPPEPKRPPEHTPPRQESPPAAPHPKPPPKEPGRHKGAEPPPAKPTEHAPIAIAASAYDSDQIANQKTVVQLCESNHVPLLGTIAALCAGSGENSWHTDGCNASQHCGFWQLSTTWQAKHDYHDVEYWTRYAIQHGFYGQGGLSAIAKAHPTWTPGQVAEACQGAGSAAVPYYDSKRTEAEAVWNRYKTGASGVGAVIQKTAELFANPLEHANVTAKRIDQGVDYAGTGYYTAFAECVVKHVWIPASGWPGNMVVFQVVGDVPMKDDWFYYAEGIKPRVSEGDHLMPGDKVCDLIAGWPSATEIGQNAGDGTDVTWAKAFGGGYNEGDLTRAGIAMSDLMHRLGGPAGLVEGRSPVGLWPRWADGGKIPTTISAGAVGPGDLTSAGVPSFDVHGGAKRGAGTYDWPTQGLAAWTAADKGASDAADTAKSLREFVNPVRYVTTKGPHN